MPRAMALLILVGEHPRVGLVRLHDLRALLLRRHAQGRPQLVGLLLFIFLGAGALGTMVAGPIADRVEPRPFMKSVLLAAAPFGFLFLLSSGPLAFVMLALYGGVLTSSFSVSIVLGQPTFRVTPAWRRGFIVGFAIGLGGAGVTALGWVADHWGVPTALWISADDAAGRRSCRRDSCRHPAKPPRERTASLPGRRAGAADRSARQAPVSSSCASRKPSTPTAARSSTTP